VPDYFSYYMKVMSDKMASDACFFYAFLLSYEIPVYKVPIQSQHRVVANNALNSRWRLHN
jgi:hypothetical protein